MDVKITKWRNSLGIRLPKNFLDELSIKEGDSLVVESNNQTIVLKKNTYGELIIKDYAEKYYGKLFGKL